MSTLAENVVKLSATISAAYDAISTKGGTLPEAKTASNLSSAIGTIQTGGGGGGSSNGNDVVFRDYDGTVLCSFTSDEVAELTALPALPTHSGLSCQEWNWTLQEIKDYVAAYGKCEIGATYTTDDGKTKIKLTLSDAKFLTISLKFSQTDANGVVFDWGDGSTVETVSTSGNNKTIAHTYTPQQLPATYTITLNVVSGQLSFQSTFIESSDVIRSGVTEVHIGDNVTQLNGSTLAFSRNLSSITLPNSVSAIGNNAFENTSVFSLAVPRSVTTLGQNSLKTCRQLQTVTLPGNLTDFSSISSCVSLKSITIPSGVTSIGIQAFYDCKSLESVTIPSSVTSIGNRAFYACASLDSLSIPNSVSNIGNNAFDGCLSLTSINVPDGISCINGDTFNDCQSLKSLVIPNSVLSIGDNCFRNTFSLQSISLPLSAQCRGYNTFSGAGCLTSIIIPEGFTTLENGTFYDAKSLASIAIPNGVSSIGASSFYRSNILTYDFRRATSIPVLKNTNAFFGTPNNKEIIVPDSLYDDWIAASNWSSTTNNIVNCIVKASESSLGPLQS